MLRKVIAGLVLKRNKMGDLKDEKTMQKNIYDMGVTDLMQRIIIFHPKKLRDDVLGIAVGIL